MYLKYLFVEGFKSFPEPSGLELDPGVCVFVGGNGTGKSNLTDAVAWVLGESDLSALRCRTADDLVFAGSDELLPMAAGTVVAVLDHRPARVKLEGLSMDACKHGHAATHTRDLPEGALTISRSIDAVGIERFRVDGVETTFEGMRTALAGLGLGSTPVSVIRQGELERLVLLDPRARRRVIEEAIGIPELGRRHDELAAELAALRLHREHLLGEGEEAVQQSTVLELDSLSVERAKALHDRLQFLRAQAVVMAVGGTSGDAPGASDLLATLGLPADPQGLPADPQGLPADPPEWAELRAAIAACDAQLQEIGPVNTRAHLDLEAARTHLADLERRSVAAEAASDALHTRARELEAQMNEIFQEALARVEDRFRSYYELLAPGGEASLPLVSGETGAGVDIMVRPPGKVLDRVDTLSGGERSLASLSLALAVFQEFDSPFFVLDEVEPALDDTNIRRLQAVLDAVADGRQLLVVSHQQRAKETGDVVFGVERNLDGASQVKFRFEPGTRRLDVFRRTWTTDSLRRAPGERSTAAPGLAADAPVRSRVMAGGGGSPTQASLIEIRGPRSGPTGYRQREDGPWEGIWESMGNPDSTGRKQEELVPPSIDGDDPPAKTCC
ncbi:MAG: AAA family ATPase [Thermoleophilia bacterium]